MILRPRQEEFVKKSVVALQEHGNTLGIAPTGAGKTILFAAVTGKIINKKQKALILAHRDELTSQNQSKFLRVHPRSVNKKLIYAAISYSISTGKKYSCTI